MNLATLLEQNAQAHPDRPALVDRHGGKDRVVSYRELARRVAAGAKFLHRIGLRRGQTILVFQPVSIELYEILLAAFHGGLRVMLADPSAGREFLALCCRRLPPDAFFGSRAAQLLRWSVREMRAIPLAVCPDWFPGCRGWNPRQNGEGPANVHDDEPALITFTSGSTGVPKGAVRTHGFLLAQHQALAEALEFETGEVDLITLPVFVLANLASGLTSVLAATDLAKPGTPDVAGVARQCKVFQVTRCAASPAFFEGLLRGSGEFPPFRKLFTGGAPVFLDLLGRLRDALPGALVHSVYGSTEAEPIAHFSANQAEGVGDLTRRGGGLCAGFAVPHIDLRIITDRWGNSLGPFAEGDFEKLATEPQQAGEIVVAGDHVLQGYLDGKGDEETKIRVAGRIWHRTGDAGWVDGQGRLWLLGRCAEKLSAFREISGLPRHALRYPFAIECALRVDFPGTRMAALEWQDLPTLVVQISADHADLPAILAAAGNLGIRQLIRLGRLPLDRRHHAKIDYPELRRLLSAVQTENKVVIDSPP